MKSVSIVATGRYLPDREVANSDLEQFPAKALPLIAKKTGVRVRRHAAADQATSDLAIAAAENCLEKAGIASSELDAVILATSSPDRLQPATATRVQATIGAVNAIAFDLNSVCSGGVYALAVGQAMIAAGQYNTVLVLASEVYSRILNPRDFATFPYFGDGAGAILLSSQQGIGVLGDIVLHTDGSGSEVIRVPAGGTALPFPQCENPRDLYFQMNGPAVYDFAVDKGAAVLKEIANRCGVEPAQVDHVVAHQANINVLREIASRSGIAFEKFFVNLDKYGNTAAASVFIALDELLDTGATGCVLMASFGGGLSWGAAHIQIS